MMENSYHSHEAEDDFVPLAIMPSSRLTDTMKVLNSRSPSVLNIDALLPPKEAGEHVLKTILRKIPHSVKVFSLRFNHLSLSSVEELISWVAKNDHLEVLYVMGSGIEEKNRIHLEHAWKKHLVNHRYCLNYLVLYCLYLLCSSFPFSTNNLGYTFIRITNDVMTAALKAEEEPLN